MIPFATCSFGGRFNYIKGVRVIPLCQTLLGEPTFTGPIGSVDPQNVLAGSTTWNEYMFGGRNSCWPGGYANHKPGAFYHGKFYQPLYDMNDDSGDLYIVRFDGSGIFTNTGDSNYEGAPWKNGRGAEFISPSGSLTELRTQEMCSMVYNNTLFMVAPIFRSNYNIASSDWTNQGWDMIANETVTYTREARAYKVFTVTIDPSTGAEKKRVHLVNRFLPNADQKEHTHGCDMIGFKGDIYFSSYVDVLKFPGGSGTPVLIENNNAGPSAKSFATFPASGYSGGSPAGDPSAFYLTGSGALKMILSPSGTETVYDMKYKNDDIRTGNTWTRILSASAEPGRSSLLLPFQNKLHAFVSTATSGYRHFILNGEPRTDSHWSDASSSLPTDMRIFDGNVFGYVDDHNDKMYVALSTMSEVGMWGYQGAQKGAGGLYVWVYDTNNNWVNVTKSVVGEPSRGLIPYQNLGPYTMIPSGSNPRVYQASDYSIVQYTLFDHFRRNTDITVEYSINEGITWNTARRFKAYDTVTFLGSGTTNLPTSPEGISYDFYWDHVNDVGFNTNANCLVRISPRLSR